MSTATKATAKPAWLISDPDGVLARERELSAAYKQGEEDMRTRLAVRGFSDDRVHASYWQGRNAAAAAEVRP